MTMNLVGQQKLFEVSSSMNNMDEDIVYSMIERHSGKASQPKTTKCITITWIIFSLNIKEALALLGSLLLFKYKL